jgi:hypothetical protein
MQDHSIADATAFPDHNVRVQHAAAPYLYLSAKIYPGK